MNEDAVNDGAPHVAVAAALDDSMAPVAAAEAALRAGAPVDGPEVQAALSAMRGVTALLGPLEAQLRDELAASYREQRRARDRRLWIAGLPWWRRWWYELHG